MAVSRSLRAPFLNRQLNSIAQILPIKQDIWRQPPYAIEDYHASGSPVSSCNEQDVYIFHKCHYTHKLSKYIPKGRPTILLRHHHLFPLPTRLVHLPLRDTSMLPIQLPILPLQQSPQSKRQ